MVWAAAGKAIAQAAKPAAKANNFIFVDPLNCAEAFPHAAPSRASAAASGATKMYRSPRRKRGDIGGVASSFIEIIFELYAVTFG